MIRVRGWGTRLFDERRRVATVAAGALALAVGYHVVFGHNGLTVYQQKRQETKNLEQQLHTLAKENESLKGHVDRLQEDPDAIEHQAREELHYTRPGEVIVTLPPEKSSGTVHPVQ
jgi:cell division protein FtsB